MGFLERVIVEHRDLSMEVIVYELYVGYNWHKCEGVWSSIEYEVFGRDTIIFEFLLKLIVEFEYDL